ncbi:unnamed protein product [Nezara viridula]|uniref:Uncharacterized protein n=1 Tax=Nezara viridula TaxID=85310 RepID=A0A9P0H0W6_NEZVI|nr:unnamed protein product [Nezara viridula]
MTKGKGHNGRGHATGRHSDGGGQNSMATDVKAGQGSLRSVVPEEEDILTMLIFNKKKLVLAQHLACGPLTTAQQKGKTSVST